MRSRYQRLAARFENQERSPIPCTLTRNPSGETTKMSAELNETPPSWTRQTVSKPVIAITAILGAVVLIWYGSLNLGVRERDKSPLEKQVDARIERLAKQSGGNLDKLSEDDRHWLQNVTQGHGAVALKWIAHSK